MFNKKTSIFSRFSPEAIGLISALSVLMFIGYMGSSSIHAAEIANGEPINIYLPKLSFLLFEDSDTQQIHDCKKFAYETVDSFSKAVNSNLVRHDKKLYVLAQITYNNCIELQLTNLSGMKG